MKKVCIKYSTVYYSILYILLVYNENNMYAYVYKNI